jgi:hypothetical protein
MGVVELLAALALGGSCPATTVHYQATRVGTVWIRSASITANLFYYTGTTLMDGRVNQSDGAVIYTGGRTPGGTTKILWTVSARGARASLQLRARRLDGPGDFTRRFFNAGPGQFPSIVDVPQAGCWRLEIRTGNVRAVFVVKAIDAPAEPRCEPTPVFRNVPHPRFGHITWMPASPRSSGLAAVLFVSTLPGAETAVVYAGGRAPEGWSTKFLWWSPEPGAALWLVGTRLDLPGSFEQVAHTAYGITPPVTGPVFPSIVDIPTAGCWAVKVASGRRAGLVVFQAVVTS